MTMGAGSSGIMVAVLAWLISAFDWRTTLLIIAALQLAISVRDKPEEMGLQPDGDLPDNPGEAGAMVAPGLVEPEGFTVRHALASSAFWRLAIAVALGNLSSVAIIVHQIPFFTGSVGLSEGAAAASVTAMTLMSLAGRFGFGYLANFVDKRFVMARAYAILVLAVSASLKRCQFGWQ